MTLCFPIRGLLFELMEEDSTSQFYALPCLEHSPLFGTPISALHEGLKSILALISSAYSMWILLLQLSDKYQFEKPNDPRALDLMNAAAVEVVKDLPDLTIAYGVSDEFSFVFHKNCQLFERRSSKLVSTIVSSFTANYIHKWSSFFPNTPLEPRYLPTFDGRAVLYPSVKNLRDYMSWRQADCHINNLYNTTFWTMVLKGGISNTEAENQLKGTVSSDKNEILFSTYGINYNKEPAMYRKGSVIFREYELETPKQEKVSQNDEETGEETSMSKTQQEKLRKNRKKAQVVVRHVDIIQDDFWDNRPWLLSNKPGRLPAESLSSGLSGGAS
ncbi:tRNA-His guanylyltransferase [Arachnomyces sp. PD_36]|nr:tRNA-His guanylyltransferase [Arachnomyces sp. PD_36]